ncbi:MAG: Ig-like domain-containing protein, partial [Eubacterium sp.]|nr:Ig-like domain-containing protein [Eubacterium sp.]
ERIVTVSSTGRIKGIRKGTAKITVKSVADPKIKKVIKVKVGTPVKKVKVSRKKLTLNVGDTIKIKAKFSPKKPTYKKLAYTSSDKTVAKVSKKGKVTALKEGKAVITVKAKDGSNKKAKVTVTVRGNGNQEVTAPTAEPTSTPEAGPTEEPTQGPEAGPTEEPTQGPEAAPTEEPTLDPEATPSAEPTSEPEATPTKAPTTTPTKVPTVAPTKAPTAAPTKAPTATPTQTPASTPTPDPVDSQFKVPYVSTYYFNPKPSTNESIKIPLYMTDYDHSDYLKNVTSGKLDLIYEVDGNIKTIKDIPLGDYTLTIGKLSEGMHYFAVQVLDKKNGMKSPKIYNDLWVVNPNTYEITSAETYKMTDKDLEKYKINNNNSRNANDMIYTRDGLSRMFADLKSAGYRKCILLNGIYRINGELAREKCITIPSNFTVDMNKSTFKLNTITTNNSASIIYMNDAVDSHLINGTLEGDRFERQALEYETEQANKDCLGETINTFYIVGGRYCSISDLEVKNTTGHTFLTQYKVGGVNLKMKEFTRTTIIDGQEKKSDSCSTSSMVDITPILEYSPEDRYMYVGHPEGYRGVKGDSLVVYVSFYDENQNFLETVTGFQFRKMRVVDNAKYARVTLLGTKFPYPDYQDSVSIYTKHNTEYFEVKNVTFKDTRTTALSPTAVNHMLIENCKYVRAGNSITPCAVDFEDGAEECQDIYYRNNNVVETSGTCTIVDNTGFNHIYENCYDHSIEIRGRVIGGVVRDCNDGKSRVFWSLGTKKLNAYGRIYDNDFSYANFKDGRKENKPFIDFKVKNCTMSNIKYNAKEQKYMTEEVNAIMEPIIYENCTFTNFSGQNATLKNCTIQPSDHLRTNLHFYDCTFKALDGKSDGVKLNFSNIDNTDRLFDNCEFKGKITSNKFLKSGVFKGCEFDDMNLSVCVGASSEKVYFEDCKINSSSGNVFEVGPNTSDTGNLNVELKDCEITHSGNALIYLTSQAEHKSKILFDNCTINKSSGYLVTGFNPKRFEDNVSLDIIFSKSKVDKNLAVDKDIDPKLVRICFEN